MGSHLALFSFFLFSIVSLNSLAECTNCGQARFMSMPSYQTPMFYEGGAPVYYRSVPRGCSGCSSGQGCIGCSSSPSSTCRNCPQAMGGGQPAPAIKPIPIVSALGRTSSLTFRVNNNGRSTMETVRVPAGATSYTWENGRPKFNMADGSSNTVAGQHQGGAGGPGTPTARTEGDTSGVCQQQAAGLPFKREGDKLMLDPENEAVKKFIKSQAPSAVNALLSGLFPEGADTRARLDAIRKDDDLKRKVFQTIGLLGRKENPAQFARAMESLFKLPAHLLTDDGQGNYGFDPKPFASLDADTERLLRGFAAGSTLQNNQKAEDVAWENRSEFDRYFGLFQGKNKEGWQDYCLVCAFAMNPGSLPPARDVAKR